MPSKRRGQLAQQYDAYRRRYTRNSSPVRPTARRVSREKKFSESWQQNYSQDPPSGRKTQCVAVMPKHPISTRQGFKTEPNNIQLQKK
jgi:hypothetical protein